MILNCVHSSFRSIFLSIFFSFYFLFFVLNEIQNWKGTLNIIPIFKLKNFQIIIVEYGFKWFNKVKHENLFFSVIQGSFCCTFFRFQLHFFLVFLDIWLISLRPNSFIFRMFRLCACIIMNRHKKKIMRIFETRRLDEISCE